jgi:hypothetical protein
MGLLDDARRDAREEPAVAVADTRETPPADRRPPDDTDTNTGDAGEAATAAAGREMTVTIGGEDVTVADPETVQPTDDGGTWLTGTEGYGRPRGIDAIEHRQIAQTSAMQSIVNGIAGQLTGGLLTFESDEATMDGLSDGEASALEDFRELLRDILRGPHLPNDSLDDLIVACVEDMVGPGQAAVQLLGSENGDVPVAALQTLDPLTIRMNVDRHGVFGDPPYWQAQSPSAGGELANLGSVDPTPLGHDDLVLLDYPSGTRSYQLYPVPPAWQVKEWLEILANSTTHHNRFYSENEIPPGLIQVIGASESTVATMKEKIEQASGDPRDVPIVGGEGGAQWLEMGGTAVNLDVIQEQQWFYELCLGAVGLGKAEVGLIEDVNRSNGEVEATRVYKRVAGPFINQFEKLFTAVARQFDLYERLGRPFTPTLEHTDPREQRAREERLRQAYQSGTVTLREYKRKTGDEDLAADDDRFVADIGGEEIDYGDDPLWVAKRKIAAAADGVPVEDPDAPEDDSGGDDDA